MALKTYAGSCHCGAVRFQADLDLSEGTNRCNCLICTTASAWFVLATPDRFRLVEEADAHAEYQWVAPGHAFPHLQYCFCKRCGIRAAGRGVDGAQGEPVYFIPIASLADADPLELAAAPIREVDAAHDAYDRPLEALLPL